MDGAKIVVIRLVKYAIPVDIHCTRGEVVICISPLLTPDTQGARDAPASERDGGEGVASVGVRRRRRAHKNDERKQARTRIF